MNIKEADKWVDEYYSDQATIKKLEAEIRHQYQVIANERDNTKTQKKALEAETKIKNLEDQVKKLKSKWKWMKDMAITKDTMEILRLSGFTVDEEVSSKFKKVMEEFGKGELKSSSGEKVTDPKQAKAIAYSEAGETKDDLSSISKHWNKATIEHILKNAHVFKPEVVEEAKRLAKEMGLNVKDSDCGKVFTKGTEDGGPGSGIKGHTTPEEQSSKSDYDDEEIKKIKEKWKNKKSTPGHGSEYGDILNHLEKQASKAGKLPDMNKYYELSDKLLEMRSQGKKDTPEYKEVEKKRNDFNKTYNKVHKALEEKARSLSSEGEQKRLDEVKQFAKKNKISQDSAIQVECNEILKLSGFIS